MSLPSQAADGDLDGYAFDATGPLGSGYFPATRSEARTKQSSCYRADRADLSSVPSRRRFDGVVIAHTGLPRYYRITGESEPDFVPVDHDEGDVDGCRLPPRSTAAREPCALPVVAVGQPTVPPWPQWRPIGFQLHRTAHDNRQL